MKHQSPLLSGSLLDARFDLMGDLRESLKRQFTDLPRKGTPAADLTERDKLALAIAAGAPTETVMDGTMMTVRTLAPVAVADRGDGGYFVAVGRAQEKAT